MNNSLRTFHVSTLCKTDLDRTVEIHHSPAPGKGGSAVKVLLIALMHGDEPEGDYLMKQFFQTKSFEKISDSVDLYVIPCLNPDGYASGTRVNGRRVDLNRNFPTKDWSSEARAERYFPGLSPGSEIEVQSLIKWLSHERPQFIVNFHSWNPMVNYNGDCEDLAQIMSSINGCPVTSDMGYPTPGSAGTWFWEALSIPSITLEIQEGWSQSQVEKSSHLKALIEVINAAAAKYRAS